MTAFGEMSGIGEKPTRGRIVLRVRSKALARLLPLALVAVALSAAVPASAAPPTEGHCKTDCLRVFSIDMYDYLQTENVTAIVKVTDE